MFDISEKSRYLLNFSGPQQKVVFCLLSGLVTSVAPLITGMYAHKIARPDENQLLWHFKPATETYGIITLIVSTVVFISILTIPIWAFGGFISSPYTSLLVTMCGLSVILTRSWWIRATVIGIPIAVLYVCGFVYVPIRVVDNASYVTVTFISVLIGVAASIYVAHRTNVDIFEKPTKAT